ncbi:hypothetical protein WHR41_03224 [Cladosporium halotolerans]|uniref:Uncharacterized protein n=1 Tax=Cladosporium halotolerans TaxID=1052096 RepID=A0AB34KW83_9PEZI
MAIRPQILTDIHLSDFVSHLLKTDTQSILIFCGSKEMFLEQLLTVGNETTTNDSDDPTSDTDEAALRANTALNELLRPPTLHQLASSRSVKLAVCPDVAHLRAYLAMIALAQAKEAEIDTTKVHCQNRDSILAILNPLDLHRSTSSFSAQGINRTFASAVEAAHATERRLLMAECPPNTPREPDQLDMGFEVEHENDVRLPDNPWDQEVSILNVTTKSFGAGGRGWVGRTVTIRRIAERWFEFSQCRLHDHSE